MIIIYKNGIIDLKKILHDIGNIEFGIENWSKVSRNLYPNINDENCYKLKIYTSKPAFLKSADSVILCETSSKENAKELKKMILDAFKAGEEQFTIKGELSKVDEWNRCTGLTDKYGKEIYSGDILQNDNGQLFEVRFGKYAMYCPVDNCMMNNVGFYCVSEGYYEDMPLGPTEEYATIIGNIHDNPDLKVDEKYRCLAELGGRCDEE